MFWVWIFGGVALLGLVVVVSYAIWLWHKASDLFSEFQMLGRRADEAAELVASLKLPGDTRLD